MSTGVDESEFQEDLFANSRMSFWDHIEELRTHMWRAIVGFVIAMCISLAFGKPVTSFIAAPVEAALEHFYDNRVQKVMDEIKIDRDFNGVNVATPFTSVGIPRDQFLAAVKGASASEVSNFPRPVSPREMKLEREAKRLSGEDPDPTDVQLVNEKEIYRFWFRMERPVEFTALEIKAQQLIGMKRPRLSTLSAMEAFMVWLKVSMYCGVVLASPWIFYQFWSFVSVGLYPTEKKLVNVYMPFSIALFLTGVLLCEFVVLPTALRYLLSFNEWMDLEPDLRLNEWLSFAIMFPLMFGVAFQTPLVMLVLHKIGIVDVDMYRKHRRIAMFGLAILTVFLTASPDWFSFLSMLIPLWGLYEFGIILCAFSPRPKYDDDQADDSEAMIGV